MQSKGQDTNFRNHQLFKLKELKEKSDPNNQPSVASSETNPDSQLAGNKGIAHIKNILHDILNVNNKENEYAGGGYVGGEPDMRDLLEQILGVMQAQGAAVKQGLSFDFLF